MAELKLNIPKPFLQEDYEKYNLELAKIAHDENTPMAVYRGHMVRAACVCGWIDDMKKADVEYGKLYKVIPCRVANYTYVKLSWNPTINDILAEDWKNE